MSVTFTKLFSSITESTIWCEPDRTRLVWITMLAMADRRGRVWASIPGLANRARVPVDDARTAITAFLSSDPDSRTPDNDGRRIEPIDGGWRLLNHGKYRTVRDEEEQAARKARNQKAYREREKNVDSDRDSDRALPEVTACDLNAEAEAEAEAVVLKKQIQENEPSALAVSETETKQARENRCAFTAEVIEFIWKMWPNKGGKQQGMRAIRQALHQRVGSGVADPVADLTKRVSTWIAWHGRETASGRFCPAIGHAQGWFGDRQKRYLDETAEPPAEMRFKLPDGRIVTESERRADGWTIMRGDE